MKMRRLKKGFTITELVIVIAVIAVLAAVLIPTFVSLVRKANESKDIQLVHNLNTALIVDGGEHKTMQSALDAALESGYDVDKINASATGNEILWDSVNDKFCYLKDGETDPEYIPDTQLTNKNPDKVSYWRISSKDEDLKGDYSIYYTGSLTEITTTVGFDAGKNTNITSVNYERAADDPAQEVTIRTNGSDLTINAPNDTVHHYGLVDELTITAVAATDCYHEYGFVKTFSSFGSGKFIVHTGAKFHQTEEEVKAVLSGKDFDLGGAAFESHYYDDNGVCVECDSVNENHNHTWSTGYLSNGTDHWNVCTVCGSKGDNEAHVFDVTDKDSKLQECTVCKKAGKIIATSSSYLKINLPSIDEYYGNISFTRTIAPGYTLIIDISAWIKNVNDQSATINVNSLEDITVSPQDSFEVIGFDTVNKTLTITALRTGAWAGNSAEISIPVLKSDGSNQTATFVKSLKVWSPLYFDGERFGPKTGGTYPTPTTRYIIELSKFDSEKGIEVKSDYLNELAKLFSTTVTWSSTVNSVVTITPDGKITAVTVGLAIIQGKVEIKSGEKTYEYVVQQEIHVKE